MSQPYIVTLNDPLLYELMTQVLWGTSNHLACNSGTNKELGFNGDNLLLVLAY